MTDLTTRKGWMSTLAKAPAQDLHALWINLGMTPSYDWLRPPEIGGVMVRGRMGGSGAPFNFGEVTVTRCTLRLQEGGAVGHAYVQGRDKDKAREAALVDALMQTGQADEVRRRLLEPLAAQMRAESETRAAKAAATKVEFFTMVRGEN